MASARLSAIYICIIYLLESVFGQPACLNNQQQRGFNNINGIGQQKQQKNAGCNIYKSNILKQNTITLSPSMSVQPENKICGQQATNTVSHLQLLKQMQQRQQQPNVFRQKQQQKFNPQLTLAHNLKPGLALSQKHQATNPVSIPMNSINDQTSNNQVSEVHFTIPCSYPSSSDPEFVPIPFKLLPEVFKPQQGFANLQSAGNMQTNQNVAPYSSLQNSAFVQNSVFSERSLQSRQNQASLSICQPQPRNQSPLNEQSSLLPQQQNNGLTQYPLPFAYLTEFDVPVTKHKSSSLKALLPLLFTLLKEKDDCSCKPCNCGCINKSNENLPQVFSGYSMQKNYGQSSDNVLSDSNKSHDATEINVLEDESKQSSTEITSEEENVTKEESLIAEDDENQNSEDE